MFHPTHKRVLTLFPPHLLASRCCSLVSASVLDDRFPICSQWMMSLFVILHICSDSNALWHREEKEIIAVFFCSFDFFYIHFCFSFPCEILFNLYTEFLLPLVPAYFLFHNCALFWENNYYNQPIFSRKNICSTTASRKMTGTGSGSGLELDQLFPS